MQGVSFSAVSQSFSHYTAAAISTITAVALRALRSLSAFHLLMGAAVALQLSSVYWARVPCSDTMHLAQAHLLLKQGDLAGAEKRLPSLSADKQQSFILELALAHAESDPAKSYEFAMQLNHHTDLLQVANSLQDSQKVGHLLQKARGSILRKTDPVRKMLDLLELMRTAHRLQHNAIAEECIQPTKELILSFESPIDRLGAFCQLAKCCSDIKAKLEMESYLHLARQELPQIPEKDVLPWRLFLARTCFDLNVISQGEEALEAEPVRAFLASADQPLAADELPDLARCLSPITANNETPSQLEPFKTAIERKLGSLSLDALSLESCLFVAQIYERLGKEQKAQEAALQAFKKGNDADVWQLGEMISYFPDDHIPVRMLTALEEVPSSNNWQQGSDADVSQLGEMISYFPGDHIPVRMLTALETVLEKVPSSNKKYFALNQVYKKMGREDSSKALFKEYEASLDSSDPRQKINSLCCGPFSGREFCLAAAEELLPQLTDDLDREVYVQTLAEAYLATNPQKSIQLLQQLQTTARNKNLRSVFGQIAAIAAACFFIMR